VNAPHCDVTRPLPVFFCVCNSRPFDRSYCTPIKCQVVQEEMDSLILKTKALRSFGTSVTFRPTTQSHTPEDCESLRSRIVITNRKLLTTDCRSPDGLRCRHSANRLLESKTANITEAQENIYIFMLYNDKGLTTGHGVKYFLRHSPKLLRLLAIIVKIFQLVLIL